MAVDAHFARIGMQLEQTLRMIKSSAAIVLSALAVLASWIVPAAAQGVNRDVPSNWQISFSKPATEVMSHIVWFGNFTLAIVAVICAVVLALLLICIFRFSEKANPEPSKVTHNTLLEVVWTLVPVLILVVIAVPSFRLLYAQYDPGRIYEDYDPETTDYLTVKVTGYQWYWGVEYSDDEQSQANGVTEEISYSAFLVPEDELGPDQLQLLSVDNPVVVPNDTFVRVQVTAGDVLHAFTIPAFGIKVDAVPGRLNETYFKAETEGMYYGQCSELCGKDHAFMPISVWVVSPDQFKQWAAAAPSGLDEANSLLAELVEKDKTIDVATR